ncbi:MAG: VOC family protein [Deltaproteobacteria bacterium]|nr:VOC family protein [Deltaproteobacteria bacterium]MBW2131539.1 VOC family protein [Deltaproteobacteria bacterium]
MRLLHAALVCETREKSDRFYRALLGLEEMGTKTVSADLMHRLFGVDAPYTLVLYGNADFCLEIFIGPRPALHPKGVEHLCLEVERPAAFLEKCAQFGVPILRIPKPDGTDLVFVTDFDGNRFEIKGN